MALKKPSDFFKREQISIVDTIINDLNNDAKPNTVSTAFESFQNNLNNFEIVSKKVESIQEEIQSLLKKEDFDRALVSQLLIVEKSIREVQDKVKGANEETLIEIRSEVSNLTNVVENLLEVEFPKYKKQVTKNQLNVGEKFDVFKDIVENDINNIKNELDDKLENVAEALDGNLEYFNQQIEKATLEVKKTTDVYNKLSKIVENKILNGDQKLNEYSQNIKQLYESFVDLQNIFENKNLSQIKVINEKFEVISSNINNTINIFNEDISNFKEKISSEILNVKADVVINEQHLKKVETYIKENYNEIVNLREEVFDEIKKLPTGDIKLNIQRLEEKIDYIRKTYSKIEPEVIVKEVIQEGLLNEPPDIKNEDPLTPLDKKFVTLDQLQQHYRLFINRIQQQLSTLGGGGETRLKYLDDVVGIATNAASCDGKYLKYDHSSGTFTFSQINGVPTFIQNTQPTPSELGGSNKYLWWDTSGGNITLWIEDGN